MSLGGRTGRGRLASGARSLGRDVAVSLTADLIKWTLGLLLAATGGYTLLAWLDLAPTPAEAIRGAPDRPVASVAVQGDGSAAQEVAEAIRAPVKDALRSRGGIERLAVVFGLSDLELGRSTQRQVDLRWALTASGQSAHCRAGAIRYHSRQELARAVAGQINDSIAASEATGRLTCG